MNTKVLKEKLIELLGEINTSTKHEETIKETIVALERLEEYEEYADIMTNHFSYDVLQLLSDKVEFKKWLDRIQWQAAKNDELYRKVVSYEKLGSAEDLMSIKSWQDKIECILDENGITLFDLINIISSNPVKTPDEYKTSNNISLDEFLKEVESICKKFYVSQDGSTDRLIYADNTKGIWVDLFKEALRLCEEKS